MALTPAWKKLRYHPDQARLWRTKARFVGVAAGRGSGKTECARRRVVRFLDVKKPWPDPIYFYALPTVAQAKRVAWEPILRLIPPEWIKGNPNKSELKIDTIFGSSLYIVGMDKPERIEGVQWDGGVVDESCDQKPGSFDRSIRPALTHKRGWCWRIGVPKRFGIGAAEFKDFCLTAHQKPETESYAWSSEDILTPEEIELAKASMDIRDYKEQFQASWETIGGAIFHAYDPILSVRDWVYRPELPILVGSDFNVNPMCWVLGQYDPVKDIIYFFDELFLRNTHTQQTLDTLWAKYKSHSGGWQFYGDAAGHQRKTSASTTDYLIIKNDRRFGNMTVHYPQANPLRVNRFAACNSRLCNARGERRCFISPNCKALRRDLEQRAWKPGFMEPDDYGDIGHMSDAFGYIVHRRWPIAYESVDTVPQVIL